MKKQAKDLFQDLVNDITADIKKENESLKTEIGLLRSYVTCLEDKLGMYKWSRYIERIADREGLKEGILVSGIPPVTSKGKPLKRYMNCEIGEIVYCHRFREFWVLVDYWPSGKGEWVRVPRGIRIKR